MSKHVNIKLDIEHFIGTMSGELDAHSWAAMSASAQSEILKKMIDVIKRGFNAAAEEDGGGDGKRKRSDLGGGGSGEEQRSSKMRVGQDVGTDAGTGAGASAGHENDPEDDEAMQTAILQSLQPSSDVPTQRPTVKTTGNEEDAEKGKEKGEGKEQKKYVEDDDESLPWVVVEQPDSSSVRVKVKSGGETVGELKAKAARKNGIAYQEWLLISGAEAEGQTQAGAGVGAGEGVGAGAGAGAEGEEEAAPLCDSATAAACGLAQV